MNGLKRLKREEINDPNALALGTASKGGSPSLFKDYNEDGFVFYKQI